MKIIGILFLIFILVHPSWSEPNRGTHFSRELTSLKQRSTNIKRSRTVVPKIKKTFQKRRKSKKATPRYVSPVLQSKLYFPEGTDEAELERVTLLEIKQLYALYRKTNKPDIQLRLASLYVDQAQLIENRIYEEYSKEFKKYQAKLRSRSPELNLKLVHEYSKRAIQLFHNYLKKYPRSKRAEEVLFQIAYSYFQLEDFKNGERYYKKLVQQFPKSQFAQAAYFHLGEYYFNQDRRWKTARYFYEKASQQEGRYYLFSLNSIAWCLFNEGQVSKSMKTLMRIINYTRSSNHSYSFAFTTAAIKALVAFYPYSKLSSSAAYSYFNRLISNQDELNKSIERIAHSYRDIGKSLDAEVVFKLLIRLYPYSPRAADYQYQIVKAYESTSQTKNFLRELKLWVQSYGVNSAWYNQNRSNLSLIQKSIQMMEKTIRAHAFSSHRSFNKTRKSRYKKLAYEYYSIYLKSFPSYKFDDEVRFQYADLLFDSKKYDQTVKEYQIILNRHKDSKHRKAASLNLVLALEKILPSSSEVRKKVENAGKTLLPLPLVVRKFDLAVNNYSRSYGNYEKEKTLDMVLILANLYEEYKYYDKSISYWMQLIKEYPKRESKKISNAVNAVLDIYNTMEDYDNLEKVGQLFLSNAKIKSLPVSRNIQKIIAEIEFKKAESLSNKGDFKGSAQLYENFATKNAHMSLSIPARFNASISYKKLKNNQDKVLDLYLKIMKSKNLSKYPKIRKQVMENLPYIYEGIGNYLKAAHSFKDYGLKYKDKKSIDYWYNAATIFNGLNLYKEAIRAYNIYRSRVKGPIRNQSYYFIGQIRERQKNKKKAIGNYVQYLNTPDKDRLRQVQVAYKVAQLYKEISQRKQARKWYKTTLSIYNKYKKGKEYASKAQLELARNTYDRAIAIKIPSNPTKQSQIVQRKIKMLGKLEADIKKVIQFKYVSEIVGALTLISHANQDLADQLVHTPPPKGLNKDELQKYKQQVLTAAEVYVRNAENYLNEAFNKADESKDYIPAFRQVQKAMQKKEDSPLLFKENIYLLTLESL